MGVGFIFPMEQRTTEIVHRIRLGLRSKIRDHKKMQHVASFFYQLYYSSVGNLHVLPDYLIIGAAKCGTSSLYEYLIQDPNIEPAIGKEINFFDMNYKKGIKWYRTYFPFSFQKLIAKKISKNNLITGEATPRYLDHPYAPKRIKESIPSVKIIALLRNPIDRAYSHWNMMVAHNRENLSFEDAIKKEDERICGLYERMEEDENFYSREYFWYAYLDRGIYVKKLKRWFQYLSKDQFLILQSEDFFRNPSENYNRVLKFLNLPRKELVGYKQFRKGSYKKQKIESTTRTKLVEFFKQHNEELYKLLDTRFDWND